MFFSGNDTNINELPLNILRAVFDMCTDCDTCRFLMEESCLFFQELYRLYDKEKQTGIRTPPEKLIALANLCTMCGLCPCPDIRADIIRGKTQLIQQNGLSLSDRVYADVQNIYRIGSKMPCMVNMLLKNPAINSMVKKALCIHSHRHIPHFHKENFFSWARKQGLCTIPEMPGVAYFAGCSAAYIFPEVARCAVEVLSANDIPVYVMPQQCCGMPTLLEGDRKTTLRRAGYNLNEMLHLNRLGFRILCSCPTCSYFFKMLLAEGAYYSEEYQAKVGAGNDEIKMPKSDGSEGFITLKKSMYKDILKDNGYFSCFDPLQRIAVADSVSTIADYCNYLYRNDMLNCSFGPVNGTMVYFSSCHQRELGLKDSYINLLRLIPGLSVNEVGSLLDCCGMGGNKGFKKDFYESSIKIGAALFNKIKEIKPEAIITDCLSCRLQFMDNLPYPVYHPLEILSRSYAAFQ